MPLRFEKPNAPDEEYNIRNEKDEFCGYIYKDDEWYLDDIQSVTVEELKEILKFMESLP